MFKKVIFIILFSSLSLSADDEIKKIILIEGGMYHPINLESIGYSFESDNEIYKLRLNIEDKGVFLNWKHKDEQFKEYIAADQIVISSFKLFGGQIGNKQDKSISLSFRYGDDVEKCGILIGGDLNSYALVTMYFNGKYKLHKSCTFKKHQYQLFLLV